MSGRFSFLFLFFDLKFFFKNFIKKYIEKCLNSERQVLSNSFKLCSSLLDLMTDIANTIQIQINDYSVLFQWTQTLATQEYASN